MDRIRHTDENRVQPPRGAPPVLTEPSGVS
jgi:hypothetical protein